MAPDCLTVDIDDYPFLVHVDSLGTGTMLVSDTGATRLWGRPVSAASKARGTRAHEIHELVLEMADALFEAFPGARVLIRMDASSPGGWTRTRS